MLREMKERANCKYNVKTCLLEKDHTRRHNRLAEHGLKLYRNSVWATLAFVLNGGMKLTTFSHAKYSKVPLKWSLYSSHMACLCREQKNRTMSFAAQFKCSDSLALENWPPVLSR